MNDRSKSRPGRARRVRLPPLGVLVAALVLGACGAGVQSPPLHQAALDGDDTEVGRLLAEGTNVDERDERGRTPLMSAAEFHQTATVKLLLQHGADINARADDGQSALSLAVTARTWASGPSPKAQAESAAYAAIAERLGEDLDLLRVLLSFGAKVHDEALAAAERADRVKTFLFLIASAASGAKPNLQRAKFLAEKLDAAGTWDASYHPEDRAKMAARLDRLGVEAGFSRQVFVALDRYLARFLGRANREARALEPPSAGQGIGVTALAVAGTLNGQIMPSHPMTKYQYGYRLSYLELWEDLEFARAIVLRQAALGATTLRAQSRDASVAILVDPGWVEASMAARLAAYHRFSQWMCNLGRKPGTRYIFEGDEAKIVHEHCGWRETSDETPAQPTSPSEGAK